MKSKILSVLLLAGLAAACVQSYISVPIPFLEKKAVDFAGFQNVYFIDFITIIPELDLAADAEIKRVFSEELSFIIDKKIAPLDPPHWAMLRDLLRRHRLSVAVEYDNSVFFQNVFKSHPRALFITGKLDLAIKKLGVVKEAKDENGKLKNIFAAVQLWEMEMKIYIIDGDSGRVVLQETYLEKMEPVEETSAQFNFNTMLAKMTAKLSQALKPRKVTQERYILLK